jgi:hypothetical protein
MKFIYFILTGLKDYFTYKYLSLNEFVIGHLISYKESVCFLVFSFSISINHLIILFYE